MKMIMNLDSIDTLEQLDEFMASTQPVAFSVASTKQERYNWLQKTLIKWRYQHCSCDEKGKVIHCPPRNNGFKRQYTDADIRQLASVDRLHDIPSGAVSKKLC